MPQALSTSMFQTSHVKCYLFLAKLPYFDNHHKHVVSHIQTIGLSKGNL